jgi:hypothetical protein
MKTSFTILAGLLISTTAQAKDYCIAACLQKDSIQACVEECIPAEYRVDLTPYLEELDQALLRDVENAEAANTEVVLAAIEDGGVGGEVLDSVLLGADNLCETFELIGMPWGTASISSLEFTALMTWDEARLGRVNDPLLALLAESGPAASTPGSLVMQGQVGVLGLAGMATSSRDSGSYYSKRGGVDYEFKRTGPNSTERNTTYTENGYDGDHSDVNGSDKETEWEYDPPKTKEHSSKNHSSKTVTRRATKTVRDKDGKELEKTTTTTTTKTTTRRNSDGSTTTRTTTTTTTHTTDKNGKTKSNTNVVKTVEKTPSKESPPDPQPEPQPDPEPDNADDSTPHNPYYEYNLIGDFPDWIRPVICDIARCIGVISNDPELAEALLGEAPLPMWLIYPADDAVGDLGGEGLSPPGILCDDPLDPTCDPNGGIQGLQ